MRWANIPPMRSVVPSSSGDSKDRLLSILSDTSPEDRRGQIFGRERTPWRGVLGVKIGIQHGRK